MGSGASASTNREHCLKVEVHQTVKVRTIAKETCTDSFQIDGSGAAIFFGKEWKNPENCRLAGQYEQSTGIALERRHINDPTHTEVLCMTSEEGYTVVPRMESFSRTSGVCKVIGDKYSSGKDMHQLEVGDFIRLGSVGLVVSEICTVPSGARVIHDDQLMYLKKRIKQQLISRRDQQGTIGEALKQPYEPSKVKSASVKLKHPLEQLSMQDLTNSENGIESDSDEEMSLNEASVDGETVAGVECEDETPNATCYVCCDDAPDVVSPLVSACKCKGGTKWVHLACLQKLMSCATEFRTCVISSPMNDAVCKVCCSEYCKHCRLEDGTVIEITHPKPSPPYICLTVVTHNAHSRTATAFPRTNTHFNSTFNISFAGVMRGGVASRPLFLGRSHACDVELLYQTVSGQHAALHYSKDTFRIQDLQSSNGTLVYIREPLKLPISTSARLRFRNRTLKLTALTKSRWRGLGGDSSTKGKGMNGLERSHYDLVMKDLMVYRHMDSSDESTPRPIVDKPEDDMEQRMATLGD